MVKLFKEHIHKSRDVLLRLSFRIINCFKCIGIKWQVKLLKFELWHGNHLANQATQIQTVAWESNGNHLANQAVAWESNSKSSWSKEMMHLKLVKSGMGITWHIIFFCHFAALLVLNLYFGLPWHTLVTLNWQHTMFTGACDV